MKKRKKVKFGRTDCTCDIDLKTWEGHGTGLRICEDVLPGFSQGLQKYILRKKSLKQETSSMQTKMEKE